MSLLDFTMVMSFSWWQATSLLGWKPGDVVHRAWQKYLFLLTCCNEIHIMFYGPKAHNYIAILLYLIEFGPALF